MKKPWQAKCPTQDWKCLKHIVVKAVACDDEFPAAFSTSSSKETKVLYQGLALAGPKHNLITWAFRHCKKRRSPSDLLMGDPGQPLLAYAHAHFFPSASRLACASSSGVMAIRNFTSA